MVIECCVCVCWIKFTSVWTSDESLRVTDITTVRYVTLLNKIREREDDLKRDPHDMISVQIVTHQLSKRTLYLFSASTPF